MPAPTQPHGSLVARARDLAIHMHTACGHTRSTGEPYWHHPERVVATLAAHNLPDEVLAAAWLHDVPEDCPADEAGCEALLQDIARDFGGGPGNEPGGVASLVREVTNYFGPEATMEQKQARLREHARHMSEGARWIKLADRLDNISGMQGWSPDKRRRYAEATRLLIEALQPLPPGSEVIAASILKHANAASTPPA